MRSPNETLLAAIFGSGNPAEEARLEAEHRARVEASDRKEAVELARTAQEKCCHGKAAAAKWLPAKIYSSPSAIAILPNGEVLVAYPAMEGFATLNPSDYENTEVFS